ncbi:MAG TPA: hypothetical protein PJ994_04375 [Tepidiformaceae bacterium]|nr:hypothetical protein [Tepidiformaceae bacterium]
MTWGGAKGRSAADRQELAARYAPLVRSVANEAVREPGASRSLLYALIGIGTQALVEALAASNVPSGPGFERVARARIRRNLEAAMTSRGPLLLRPGRNKGIPEER